MPPRRWALPPQHDFLIARKAEYIEAQAMNSLPRFRAQLESDFIRQWPVTVTDEELNGVDPDLVEERRKELLIKKTKRLQKVKKMSSFSDTTEYISNLASNGMVPEPWEGEGPSEERQTALRLSVPHKTPQYAGSGTLFSKALHRANSTTGSQRMSGEGDQAQRRSRGHQTSHARNLAERRRRLSGRH